MKTSREDEDEPGRGGRGGGESQIRAAKRRLVFRSLVDSTKALSLPRSTFSNLSIFLRG